MLEYDPNGEARVLHLTFGPESQRFEDMLENLAADWLREKEEKLKSKATPGIRHLIALDFRSLVLGVSRPGTPATADEYWPQQFTSRRTAEHRAALVRGVQLALQSATVLSGALIWCRKFDSTLDQREGVVRPWEVSLITRNGETEIPNPSELKDLCRQLPV